MSVESSSQFQKTIEELKARLEAQRPKIEQEISSEKQREFVRGEISGYVAEAQHAVPAAVPAHIKGKVTTLQTLEPTQQVGALVTMVFEEGLEPALSIAKALNNPAILDEFHDILVDYFFDELVARGIIKLQ